MKTILAFKILLLSLSLFNVDTHTHTHTHTHESYLSSLFGLMQLLELVEHFPCRTAVSISANTGREEGYEVGKMTKGRQESNKPEVQSHKDKQ